MSAPNVLANRYASSQMRAIWGQENKIIAERRLWITIMEAQAELGVGFGGEDPATVIADYQAVVEDVEPRLHRRARGRAASRRQGPYRGVQRPGRP